MEASLPRSRQNEGKNKKAAKYEINNKLKKKREMEGAEGSASSSFFFFVWVLSLFLACVYGATR